MEKIRYFFSGLALICVINLVPYLMSFVMYLSDIDKWIYQIASIIKSLFSIPTSLFGFALQYDLGDFWWGIGNLVVFIIALLIIKLDL